MKLSQGKVRTIRKALQRSEHDEQKTLFAWAAIASGQHRELGLMFAIPNGGQRHVVVAAKLKAEGVKRGVPDIFLPVAKRTLCGLFVEMKRADGVPSDVSREQKRWNEALVVQGYRVVVAYGFEHARKEILEYLSL